MSAPAQNLALDFFQATKLRLDGDRAIRQRQDLLRFVPGPFRHQPRGITIESEPDAMLLTRRKNVSWFGLGLQSLIMDVVYWPNENKVSEGLRSDALAAC